MMLGDFAEAAVSPGFPRAVCALGLSCIALFLSPRFASKTHRFSNSAPFETSLGAKLTSLRLSGVNSVQCFDTYSGCVGTLYNLRIIQATGYLYDCYLFQPPSQIRDSYREEFLHAFEEARPQVVIVTDQPCFGERSFDRLGQWPALAQRLDRLYVLSYTWRSASNYYWWSRSERPVAFRVYVRK
jgi:hypothetical protein